MRQLTRLTFERSQCCTLVAKRVLLYNSPPSTRSSCSSRISVRAMASDKAAPPFPEQKQPGAEPGKEQKMSPRPDFGEKSYHGSGKLKGKVSLVTGADSGIGRAIALAFAREGSDVAIAYWKEHDDAKETASWIEDAGQRAILLPGDLADESTCQKVIDETISQLGQIDILVNNASQQEDALDSFIEISRERLERTFHVNLIAMFRLAQKNVDNIRELRRSPMVAAVEHMLQRGSGNIINISSIQAYKPSPGILDYSCTKGAIVTLTKGVALETAEKNIRCNCIAPGPVWTPLVVTSFPTEKTTSLGEGQVPMNRPGMPSEFQGTAVYLASDADSSYVTGAIINVTGGQPHIA